MDVKLGSNVEHSVDCYKYRKVRMWNSVGGWLGKVCRFEKIWRAFV